MRAWTLALSGLHGNTVSLHWHSKLAIIALLKG
jgi:hypothetical protein